ncbi:MAG TPA: hypothetical protein VL354_06990 [Spirochaetia bacterium]|nr:hypothetical protein [Spirochaetia bacterium]
MGEYVLRVLGAKATCFRCHEPMTKVGELSIFTLSRETEATVFLPVCDVCASHDKDPKLAELYEKGIRPLHTVAAHQNARAWASGI